jgi:hypothetical protein
MNRLSQEKKKSQDKSSDEAISAVYDIISGYNGIVSTIIERTKPVGGKWSTRKSVDQSTIMYLAEVLKGLIEPLKHLEFQLNQVKDPDLATLQNMMNNLVKIIDQSPPFKMLDVEQYRFGIPNYEGLADDLNITSGKGYLSLLEKKKKELTHKLKMLTPHVRKAKGEISEKIFQHAKKTLEAVEKEIKKSKHLVNAQLKDVVINGPLNLTVKDTLDALDELFTPASIAENGRIVKSGPRLLTETKGKTNIALLRRLIKEKNELESGFPLLRTFNYMDGSSDFDAQRLPPDTKDEYLLKIKDISDVQKRLNLTDKEVAEMTKAASRAAANAAREEAADAGEYEADSVPDTTAPGTPVASAPAVSAEDMARAESAIASDPYGERGSVPRERQPGEGQGAGRPLADLLANPKQQYNSMKRPISNDQKIQNDMINANKNWQIKNNPPHDTPIGNLNPFLAQDNASKYTYEVLLANKNAIDHPETNARGADISLLQGPITNVEGSGKKSKALLKLKKVAIDERNDPYKKVGLGSEGYIPEEKEDQFKLPDLKPKKRK